MDHKYLNQFLVIYINFKMITYFGSKFKIKNNNKYKNKFNIKQNNLLKFLKNIKQRKNIKINYYYI